MTDPRSPLAFTLPRSVSACALACGALALAACGDNLTLPPERDAAQSPTPVPLACVPNLDGRIDASELAAAIDIPIRYLVNPPGVERSVDVAGTTEGGAVAWDFGVDFADDQELTVTPRTTDGAWYVSSFPPDAFVAPFDPEGRIETISRLDDDGLYLLGLASSEPDPAEGRTLLVYDVPVQVLAFPVEPGQTLTSVGELVNATLNGLPYAGRDIYETEVDARGTIELPTLIFEEVHRVRTKVTVEPSVGAAQSRIQVSYYAECFAEVARAVSRPDETDEAFTTAAELRRIGFPR
jgi:hypothetical protein